MRSPLARVACAICAAIVLFVSFMPVYGQQSEAGDEEATRLARAAERFEAQARVIKIFDRSGKVTATVGERGLYITPTLSPDGLRIAVVINDIFNEMNDLWVIDIRSGERQRITANGGWDTEWTGPAVWSPDGSTLAYVAMRDGYEGIYLQGADGTGEAELLYRHPGANIWLGDWSADGRFLSVSTTNPTDGNLYVLPIDGDGQISEILYREARVMAGSFSPDGRLLYYRSEETGINEIYVWDLETNSFGRRVTENGGLFGIRGQWSADRDEIYYLAPGETVYAAKIDRDLRNGSVEHRRLFDLSPAIRPGPVHTSVSRDGERILIAVPHSPTLSQITVFDREGNELQRIGEPGVWRNPTLSPDGKSVAVQAWRQDTSFFDIWTFDIESGRGVAVTTDNHRDDFPIWSPDSRELAFVSLRDDFSQIIRKSRDGSGQEIEVFTYEPGAFMGMTDWSQDGRFISFNDLCWGVLYVLPLHNDPASGDGRAMEWLRNEYQVALARFSPDNRYIAYLSDEAEPDVFNLYVSPFDPDLPDGRVPGAVPLRATAENVRGMVSWRKDGNELYYLTNDWEVMALEISAESGAVAGEPEVLFRLPGPLPGEPRQWKSAAPDGQRFVFVLNVPVSLQ